MVAMTAMTADSTVDSTVVSTVDMMAASTGMTLADSTVDKSAVHTDEMMVASMADSTVAMWAARKVASTAD